MADAVRKDDLSPWMLNEQAATLQFEQLRGKLDFNYPELGVSALRAGHESLPGSLLRVAFAPSVNRFDATESTAPDRPSVTECYLRGADAVAVYPPDTRFPFRSQVYWRALSPAEDSGVASCEVIVSTQTDLLDSHPRISVSTSLPAIELWRLSNLEKAEFRQISLAKVGPQQVHYTHGPGCYLWRLSGERWSFAEMLPPSDFYSTDIVRDESGLISLTHRLFERSLEKGVILRARVRGILLERGRDAVTAIACYRQLLQSELPLTT